MLPATGQNLSAFERNRTFLNIDGDSFIDVSFASVADIDSDSRSVVAADFNRDGATDLLVGSVGGGPMRLFLNRYPNGNHVSVRLVGTKSNRLGIGARLVAKAGSRQIVRDVFPPNGFMGQGPTETILGIGNCEKKSSSFRYGGPAARYNRCRTSPVARTSRSQKERATTMWSDKRSEAEDFASSATEQSTSRNGSREEFRSLVVVAVALFLIACGSSDSDLDGASSPEAKAQKSHKRMVKVLANLAKQDRRVNPYYSDIRVRKLQQSLDRFPPDESCPEQGSVAGKPGSGPN